MATAAFPSPLVGDALDYLTDLATSDMPPAEAQGRLQEVRERHPGSRLRLLWQREAFDDSVQYDLLITRPRAGTVSLSYCPEHSLPWPLRGGQREHETILLRVNGEPMELEQVVACLDFLWDEAPLTERLVSTCLLRQELDEQPVTLSDDELQNVMDAFRRARGLRKAAATMQWMARRCLSHRDLEDMVAREAAVARLRNENTRGQVPAYFEEHRRQLDCARIARLLFAAPADAQNAIDDIDAGSDFASVAERSFVADRLSSSSPYFLAVRRDELDPEIAGCVFDARPGATLGPFLTCDGHAVIRVLQIERAVLDDSTARLIEERLFAQWLARRRQSARVEWFWGNAARTDPRASTGAA